MAEMFFPFCAKSCNFVSLFAGELVIGSSITHLGYYVTLSVALHY
jgi:hypothetical protein